MNRESEFALVGGVNLMLSPHTSLYLSQAGMIGPDAKCKAFDATANGFGRGEGCNMLFLRRLDDAVRNGDNILAVLPSM